MTAGRAKDRSAAKRAGMAGIRHVLRGRLHRRPVRGRTQLRRTGKIAQPGCDAVATAYVSKIIPYLLVNAVQAALMLAVASG